MVGKIARRNHKQPIISRRMRNKIVLTISILVVIAIVYWAACKPNGPPDTFIQMPGSTSHGGGVNLGYFLRHGDDMPKVKEWKWPY